MGSESAFEPSGIPGRLAYNDDTLVEFGEALSDMGTRCMIRKALSSMFVQTGFIVSKHALLRQELELYCKK